MLYARLCVHLDRFNLFLQKVVLRDTRLSFSYHCRKPSEEACYFLDPCCSSLATWREDTGCYWLYLPGLRSAVRSCQESSAVINWPSTSLKVWGHVYFPWKQHNEPPYIHHYFFSPTTFWCNSWCQQRSTPYSTDFSYNTWCRSLGPWISYDRSNDGWLYFWLNL